MEIQGAFDVDEVERKGMDVMIVGDKIVFRDLTERLVSLRQIPLPPDLGQQGVNVPVQQISYPDLQCILENFENLDHDEVRMVASLLESNDMLSSRVAGLIWVSLTQQGSIYMPVRIIVRQLMPGVEERIMQYNIVADMAISHLGTTNAASRDFIHKLKLADIRIPGLIIRLINSIPMTPSEVMLATAIQKYQDEFYNSVLHYMTNDLLVRVVTSFPRNPPAHILDESNLITSLLSRVVKRAKLKLEEEQQLEDRHHLRSLREYEVANNDLQIHSSKLERELRLVKLGSTVLSGVLASAILVLSLIIKLA
jgi:hypothetical protein